MLLLLNIFIITVVTIFGVVPNISGAVSVQWEYEIVGTGAHGSDLVKANDGSFVFTADQCRLIKPDNSIYLIEPYFTHKSSISFRYWLDCQVHTKHIYHIFSRYC